MIPYGHGKRRRRLLWVCTSPDSGPALTDLVSAIIERPVISVVVRNNELPPDDTQDKAERLDINCQAITCHTGSNAQVDIEMQASRVEEVADGEHRNFTGKSVYYGCDYHSSQSARGVRRYDSLIQTYQATFVSYTVFPNRPGFVNRFSLRHDLDNGLLTDAFHLVFVELSKLAEIIRKRPEEMTDLEKWSIFFRYADIQRYRDTVNEIIQSREAIQMAGDVLLSVSQDERERAIFRSRQMYQTDMQSNWNTAYDNGRHSERIEIAKRMISRQRPIDEIIEDTGLTYKEVMGLSESADQ